MPGVKGPLGNVSDGHRDERLCSRLGQIASRLGCLAQPGSTRGNTTERVGDVFR